MGIADNEAWLRSTERDDGLYRLLAENSSDVIAVVDPNGVYRYMSPASRPMFGYEPEEMIGKLAYDFMHPDDQAIARATHQLAVSDPEVVTLERRVRRKDGTYCWVETTARRICDPVTGEVVEIQAASRDITDRKHAHEAQARLAAIVQSSHDAVISSTPSGIITTWNAGAERLFGYSAEEVIGRDSAFLRTDLPDREAEAAAIMERIERGEWIDEHRTERLRRDGTAISVSISVSPVLDDRGAVIGIGSVVRDLTDLERAEAKFRSLLEAAPDAMVCLDQQGRISLVNAQAEHLFGFGRDELAGQPVEVLMPEELRPSHPGHRASYMADRRARPMGAGTQLAARRKDGTSFPADISLSSVNTEDGVLVIAAVRDVTERLEAQAEHDKLRSQTEQQRLAARLRQSERLESLGQLAGGVAHDFNNLLGAIQGYAAFVKEEVNAAAAEGQQRWVAVGEDVEKIERAAERAAALTHQLLAFARRDVVRPETLDLNELVSAVEPLLQPALGEHISLVTALSPGIDAIRADRGQLEEVLVNLAVNARDAMPSGGTLTIQTSNIGVDDHYASGKPGLRPGRYVAMRMSDTGIGMDAAVIERAFEPFFTTKPKGQGTGLGLASVYGIISQAGGHTQIYSEPGIGTTITVLLPATAESPSQEPPQLPTKYHAQNATILVVEDEDGMREVTRRILAGHGYQVLIAANGTDALRVASDHQGDIALLLTDVVMPGMLGNEVADRLIATRPGTSVLYMSGYAQGVLGPTQILETDIRLIEKPFSGPVLLDAVREALEQGSP
jgi:two-component system, cell cycle sensor histidine kinase and response regulator CckA